MAAVDERKLPLEDVLSLARRHNTWGKWGDDDQLGAVNNITPAEVASAAQLVTRGVAVSCAMAYDQSGPQTGSLGRTNPIHYMLQDGGDVCLDAQTAFKGLRYADDGVTMPLQCGTHWDALSHIFYEKQMYNGFSASNVTSAGAAKCALETLRDRLVGRGVLLDIARHRGLDALAPGDAIGADELANCADCEGVEIRKGDIVLVRTGQLAKARAEGWGTYAGGDAPGLALSSADFLCPAGVAAVAADTWGAEVRPNETDDLAQPLHVVMLVNAGVIFGEMFDLEALAAACAEDGVYEFFFAAAPLPFTGAVGGPLNPVAVK